MPTWMAWLWVTECSGVAPLVASQSLSLFHLKRCVWCFAVAGSVLCHDALINPPMRR